MSVSKTDFIHIFVNGTISFSLYLFIFSTFWLISVLMRAGRFLTFWSQML